jgi:hypothetical protein
MANVLKMATVADIITLIKTGYSDRRISAVLSLDRGTVAKYRRQLQAGESPKLPAESAHPEDRSGVTIENPSNAPTGLGQEGSGLPVRTIKTSHEPLGLIPRPMGVVVIQCTGSISSGCTTTAKRRTSGYPVFHTQPRNCGEITVAGYDNTVSQFAGNRCDHDVNLLHRSANPLQFRCNPTVLFC